MSLTLLKTNYDKFCLTKDTVTLLHLGLFVQTYLNLKILYQGCTDTDTGNGADLMYSYWYRLIKRYNTINQYFKC